MIAEYKPPFVYFGGKSSVADLVWSRFGNVDNYVEPFFGSGAMLFLRPNPGGTETVNDADGLLANFWRALQREPDAVAEYADWPVSECDLHARHLWLLGHRESITERLCGDPDWFDAKAAGWWCWGLNCWIGSGWCSGNGPWIAGENGEITKGSAGRGVNRQLPHLGDAGKGECAARREWLIEYLRSFADRLRNVRVCCGDWSRICGPSVTTNHGITGVFLDPPYADTAKRTSDLYATDCLAVAHDARKWAIEMGQRADMRICLCGYDGEHSMPDNWECVEWKARGGYGSQGNANGKENCHRERLWFSPACLRPQRRLFA